MFKQKITVSSGVPQLDALLGGLFIGDNVIWYDDAGSLAALFCLNFIQESESRDKAIVYVTFDRSPKTVMQELGPLAEHPNLTILDCFTDGKGEQAAVFSRFYDTDAGGRSCRVIRVEDPSSPERVTEAIDDLHRSLTDDVRFVFDSLTGMQDLWEGEDRIIKFYSRSCPRLYELETIAYWVIEKAAHSARLKARINQIAQVAIELSLKRGKSTLTILKADSRKPDTLDKPNAYWNEGMTVHFDPEGRSSGRIDLGARLRDLRTRQGVSQKELARQVGVTPSTISQIESSQIFPSLPALFKIAEVLAASVGSFFQDFDDPRSQIVFPAQAAVPVVLSHLPKQSVSARLLTRPGMDAAGRPYLIEVAPKSSASGHFFLHKGEEMGYLLEGTLRLRTERTERVLQPGDLVYLTRDVPLEWRNTEDVPARLLWVVLTAKS